MAAPWYYALLAKKSNIPLEALKKFVTGCIAARGMFYIKPDGEVWPCPFIPISGGNVAKRPAKEIWEAHSSQDSGIGRILRSHARAALTERYAAAAGLGY